MPTVHFVVRMCGAMLLSLGTRLAAAQEAAPAAQPAGGRQEPQTTESRAIDGFTWIWNDLVLHEPNLLAFYDPRPRATATMSEFWIGVDGVSPDETLRAQLSLPRNQGVVVNQVIEGSPAERAGIKQYDVLLTADDQSLASTEDLAKVIAEKKETPIALVLIRGGGKMKLEVAAERRPATQTGETCPAVSRASDEEFIKAIWQDLMGKPPEESQVAQFTADKSADKRVKLANKLLRNAEVAKKSCSACHQPDQVQDVNAWLDASGYLKRGANKYNFNVIVPEGQAWLFQPGAQVKRWTRSMPAAPRIKLPDDVEITISRRGMEPARITVSRGDKRWECTEEELATKLPKDLRPLVQSMLPGNFVPSFEWNFVPPFGWHYDVLTPNLFKDSLVEQRQRSKATPKQKLDPAAAESAEQEIKRRLEEIASEVEGLKKKLDR